MPSNYETAYALGELHRQRALQVIDDSEKHLGKAIEYFEKAREGNPYHAPAWMRIGMCFDLLGEFDKAEPFFKTAQALDPNGFSILAHYGWHQVQKGDFANAKPFLEK